MPDSVTTAHSPWPSNPVDLPTKLNEARRGKPEPSLCSPYAWLIPGEEKRLELPPPLLGVVPVLRPTKVGRRRSQGEGGTRPIVTPRRPQGVASREDGQDPLSSLTLRAILSRQFGHSFFQTRGALL